MNFHDPLHTLAIILVCVIIAAAIVRWLAHRTIAKTWSTGRKLTAWENLLRRGLHGLDCFSRYVRFAFVAVVAMDIVGHMLQHLFK